MRRGGWRVGVLALLAGCAPRPVVDGEGAGAAVGSASGEVVAPGARPSIPGVQAWRVERGASLLTVRVYRAGPMARLGHNHVIASRHLAGELQFVAREPAQSRLSLNIPVALLTVDEPELRAAAGAEFADPVPDEAREGTRRNLLSPALLDAVRHPGITADTVELQPRAETPGGYRARVIATVRGQRRKLWLPVEVQWDGSGIEVRSNAMLRQTELGLTPFSVMMGALQVQDEILIDLRLRLRPAGP